MTTMTTEETDDFYAKFRGCEFNVTADPDYSGFYSVWAGCANAGAEVAGKIGERSMAVAIAQVLAQMTGGRFTGAVAAAA